MLETESLTKIYGKTAVLNRISFKIEKGEIIGIVGPNGSGKTTLLNILTGMLNSTSGSYTLDDNVRLGMSISRRGFFNNMSTAKNILMYSSLVKENKMRPEQLMEYFNIDFQKVPFGKLSAGMKQKVSLLLAFLEDSNLILLDEPSTHLDIDSLIKLREHIVRQKDMGTSFVITSHIVSDLEQICSRILFLKQGKLYKDITTFELIEQYGNLENAYLQILTDTNENAQI